MEKTLLAWMLEWRWEYKQRRYKHSVWRKMMTARFMDSPEYKSKKWTSDDFIKTWSENEARIMYKGGIK